ncbi:1-acyl-sn-glycerol-3-phosphate acyltransferase [bacterium]|nr:1-acyl-sn-glycerol-3-phosphate acyltransferase [bacterium]
MLLLPYWQPQIQGLEHWPAQGPAILVANHPTLFDPFLVGAITPRPLDFFVRHEVLRIPVLGTLIGWCQPILVRPGPSALEAARRRLEQGRAVMIFPEGHQTHQLELEPFRSGAAALAVLSGVAVIPLGLSGPEQLSTARGAWVQGGRMVARFGPPLQAEPGETSQQFGERLRRAVSALLIDQPVATPQTHLTYRLAQAFWVPATWLIFKLADWINPNNRR